jgi:protease I
VRAAGAEFINSEAAIDGSMISARAWPDHPAWMREFIKLLKQKAPTSEQRATAR